MRIVLDTNIAISGMLWSGRPQQLLDQAHDGTIRLYTCRALLDELMDVLNRPKLVDALAQRRVRPRQLLKYYESLCAVVKPAPVGRIVPADPDDDIVIACAIGAKANYIVTGDLPLRSLEKYKAIKIVSAGEMMDLL